MAQGGPHPHFTGEVSPVMMQRGQEVVLCIHACYAFLSLPLATGNGGCKRWPSCDQSPSAELRLSFPANTVPSRLGRLHSSSFPPLSPTVPSQAPFLESLCLSKLRASQMWSQYIRIDPTLPTPTCVVANGQNKAKLYKYLTNIPIPWG